MKQHNIYSCLFLASVISMSISHINAQEKSNYVLTQTQISDSKKTQNYQFFDDLGRGLVEATNGVSNNGVFTYSYHEYLGEKSEMKNWLPVVGGVSVEKMGKNSIVQSARQQYADESAFEYQKFDALGRLLIQNKAGDSWKEKPARIDYVTNSSADVKRYSAYSYGKYIECPTYETTLSDKGYYKEGTLYGTCEINEDNTKVTIFKDELGRKILERRDKNNDTYFVYDEWDQLAFVLMPEYQNNNDVDRYAFQYSYDILGNLVKKKMPGCESVEYVYDDYRRPFLIQDGELREKGRYRFLLYDKVGRVVVQGICIGVPETIESTVCYSCGSKGTKYSDYVTPEGRATGLYIDVLEKIFYYDDYSFFNGSSKVSSIFQDFNQPSQTNARGMLTGSVILASNGERIASVYSYDILGNQIEVQEKGLDGSIVKTENTYTYTKKLATSKITITHPKGESVVYDIKNIYNPNNDLLLEASYQAKIGNISTDECKIIYTYDQLGRIANISRPISNGKGDVSYDYDIHGWLTNITSNSFSEQLHYHDGAGTPLYSGNISSMTWKNGSSVDKGYMYTYDELGRIINSEYGENNFSKSLGNYDERVSYDGNGNIISLVRNGVTGMMMTSQYGLIDNLTMEYNGNQLQHVEEGASSVLYSNFIDVKKSSSDFRYNSCGSLVRDGTRGITNIRYDSNNNPIRIQFDNGNVTKYVYTVTGQKLRTIHYTAPKNIRVEMGRDYEDIETTHLTKDSTDYLWGGKVIYENSVFSKILFDGGYIDSFSKMESLPYRPSVSITDGEYKNQLEDYIRAKKTREIEFKFYNKDHLGNNREVIDKDGVVCQRNDFYPYGTPFFSLYRTINECNQPYKYNGKEFDMMHGLNTYDYGARQYSPILPMWDRVDPLAEKYYNVSPYAYCAGNPVKFVDPNGKEPTEEEAARIAAHVYNNEDIALIGGWQVSTLKIDGVRMTDNDSGFKSQLYERTQDGKTEYVYATAGTDITSMKDWSNNIKQILGKSRQYNISMGNAETIKEAIGKRELTYVGHSLGGGLAAANAYTTGDKAMTFNAAWVSPLTKPFNERKNAQINAYVHYRDELNLFQKSMHVGANGNRIYRYKNRDILGHSIRNFYRDKKENMQDMIRQAQDMFNSTQFWF